MFKVLWLVSFLMIVLLNPAMTQETMSNTTAEQGLRVFTNDSARLRADMSQFPLDYAASSTEDMQKIKQQIVSYFDWHAEKPIFMGKVFGIKMHSWQYSSTKSIEYLWLKLEQQTLFSTMQVLGDEIILHGKMENNFLLLRIKNHLEYGFSALLSISDLTSEPSIPQIPIPQWLPANTSLISDVEVDQRRQKIFLSTLQPSELAAYIKSALLSGQWSTSGEPWLGMQQWVKSGRVMYLSLQPTKHGAALYVLDDFLPNAKVKNQMEYVQDTETLKNF